MWPSFTNVPQEYLEAYFPLRIERHETVADTGGAGKNRGGNALRVDYCEYVIQGNRGNEPTA